MANPNTPSLPPELANILATLAQFAPAQQQSTPTPPPSAITFDPRLQGRSSSQQSSSQPQHGSGNVHHPDQDDIFDFYQNDSVAHPVPGPKDYTDQQQLDSASSHSYDPTAVSSVPPKPQRRAMSQQQPQQEHTIIDPATITEWSAGLRCVTKIAAQNNMFAEKIRSMINDQRRNEMQWYSSRQALKQTQAKRAASTNEIQNILKAVGGNIPAPSNATPVQTPEEKEAELAAFDRKLYRAQIEMNEVMANNLKGLGVPFFGTHASLILPEGDEADASTQDAQGDRPKWSPRITPKELQELKRRMITHLEDMYKT